MVAEPTQEGPTVTTRLGRDNSSELRQQAGAATVVDVPACLCPKSCGFLSFFFAVAGREDRLSGEE